MAASFEEFTETELARLDAERIEDDKLRAGQLLNYVLRGKGGLLPASGLVLEFGVFKGQSINKLGRVLQQPIFGFDSFEGLPEDWDVGNAVIPREAFDRQGNLPEVLPNVVLIKGWFEQRCRTSSSCSRIRCASCTSTAISIPRPRQYSSTSASGSCPARSSCSTT